MRKTAITLGSSFLVALALGTFASSASADGAYQSLPFSQNWGNIAAIAVNDDWSGVPGIIGFRGDNITAATGVDPQTLLADDSPGVVDVNANQTNPVTFISGGVTEFELANPTVAIYGSGTADAPYLLLHINTLGNTNISVNYTLRDVEAGTDDAVQQFALQYRVGGVGPYTNVPAAYVADATTGGTDVQTTNVSVTLPGACDNQAQVQLRIMTTNAIGNDEATGVDDISITGTPIAANVLGVNLGWSNCGTTLATSNRSFTCDDNGTSFSLVGSFKNGFDVADFVAVSAALDVSTSSPTIPAWFSFGIGGCREGELSLGNVGNIAGCTNPYSGANQGGGLIVEGTSSPDRFRVRLDWARDIPGLLSGADLNTAFVLGMSSANSFDEGFGMCAGCNVPACFVLNAVEVFSNSQGRVRIHENPDVRNWASWQGGTGNCPGATPSRKATWGQVKALYR
jgi:hypothetical protein